MGISRNYFTEMCSGSEGGSYLRLIDCVHHSILGFIVMKKRRRDSEEIIAEMTCRVKGVHNLQNQGGCARRAPRDARRMSSLQGYLAHKKTSPPRNLQ